MGWAEEPSGVSASRLWPTCVSTRLREQEGWRGRVEFPAWCPVLLGSQNQAARLARLWCNPSLHVSSHRNEGSLRDERLPYKDRKPTD